MAIRENLTEEEKKQRLRKGVEIMYGEYVNNAELTIFTTSLESAPL